jgi:glycosidase
MKALTPPEWVLKNAVYQINVRTFSPEGTISSVTERLPALSSLGFKIMYLCPVFKADASLNRDHWSERQKKFGTNNPKNPYRIYDYFEIDEEYGTKEDLLTFVKTAHGLGMKVIFDLVYTHLGPNAPIIKKNPDFALRDENGNIIYNSYHFITLNYESQELREYLYSNMEYFLREFQVDGFRCDYCDSIPEDFWIEAHRRMKKINKDTLLIEEGCKKERLLTAFESMYGFQFHEDLYKLLRGELDCKDIRKGYEEFKKDLPEGALVLRDLDNHDTVTDWPERSELVKGSSAMEAIIAFNYTIDGIPMVYCGNEIACKKRHNMFANRFYPGGYETTDRTAPYDEDALRRMGVIKRLNEIRFSEKTLWSGETKWIETEHANDVLAFSRSLKNETIIFIGNFSEKTVSLSIKAGSVLLENGTKHSEKLDLAPYGYIIFKEVKL